jgi:hypothetical protein
MCYCFSHADTGCNMRTHHVTLEKRKPVANVYACLQCCLLGLPLLLPLQGFRRRRGDCGGRRRCRIHRSPQLRDLGLESRGALLQLSDGSGAALVCCMLLNLGKGIAVIMGADSAA